jgi:hypothetical protein
MVTAITHDQFRSPLWTELDVLRLFAELTEIEVASLRALRRAQPESGR